MPSRTKAEKDIKIKFDISTVEREMLEELKDVLEMFEFVTDEFQSNRVNISRVYPAVKYLRENLLAKDSNDEPIVYKYSTNLRKDLLSSLNKRFDKIINDDVFLISTFLDPNFGLSAFDTEFQEIVKAKIIALSKMSVAKQEVINNLNVVNKCNSQKENNLTNKRKENYKKHKSTELKTIDKEIVLIEEFASFIEKLDYDGCPLEFWRENEQKYYTLAQIARKYLGVPASSAAVERMFSISGHILSSKRTKMSIKLFCHLVFLKLNENLL
jgi:hypothetical protein